MKKNILYTLLSIAALFIGSHIQLAAQTIPAHKMEYTYDANGNRITRTVTTLMVFSKMSPDDLIKEKPAEEDNTAASMLLEVGPNPTHNSIKIAVLNAEKANNGFSYTLTATTGALIFTRSVLGNNEQIDMSNLMDGMYMLKLNLNGKTYYYKIIKASN